MMTSQYIKAYLLKTSILALAIIFLESFVAGFIVRYLTFLNNLGTFGDYLIKFLAIVTILIPGDWILNKAFGVK